MDILKVCQVCGNETAAFESICPSCGADLTVVPMLQENHKIKFSPIPSQICPDMFCGASNPLDQKTCLYCGTPLVLSAQPHDRHIQITWPWGIQALTTSLAIGRDPSFSPLANNLSKYLDISRVHCILRLLPNGFLEIEDLGSKYGTVIDGALFKAKRKTIETDAEVRFSKTFKVLIRFVHIHE